MLEVRAHIGIQSPLRVIWEYMNNVEGWWALSSSDHVSLEFLSPEHHLQEGMRSILRERFGLIHGESQGTITRVIPEQEVIWWSERAVYSYLFFHIPVAQTVAWHAQEKENEVVLSMNVRLAFLNTTWGKISEWYFIHVLRGEHLVSEHSLKELVYLKKAIEA